MRFLYSPKSARKTRRYVAAPRARSPSPPPTPHATSPRVSPNTSPLRPPRFEGFLVSPPPSNLSSRVSSKAPSRRPSPKRRSPLPSKRRSPSPVRVRPPSPSKRRSPSPVRVRSPSPVRVHEDGETLQSFHGVVFDMCALTVMLIYNGTAAQVAQRVALFKKLLTREGIFYESLPASHPFARTGMRMHSPTDMHRLMCKLPGRLTNVMRE